MKLKLAEYLFMRYAISMHIITHRRLLEAADQHQNCVTALDQWYRLVKKTEVHNFSELRQLFRSVDKVGELYVFNVGGNKLRIIAAIHFNRQKLYIRAVLTHLEYDQEDWKP